MGKGKKAELMERLAVAVEKDKEKAAKKYLDKKLKEFEGMKDKELKKELQDRDLSTKGGRDDYMKLLKEAATKESKKEFDRLQKKKAKKLSDQEKEAAKAKKEKQEKKEQKLKDEEDKLAKKEKQEK